MSKVDGQLLPLHRTKILQPFSLEFKQNVIFSYEIKELQYFDNMIEAPVNGDAHNIDNRNWKKLRFSSERLKYTSPPGRVNPVRRSSPF